MRLGRMYRTTSPELDMWRGLYTFSSDHLAFYELSADIYPPNTVNTSNVGAGANPNEPSMEIVKVRDGIHMAPMAHISTNLLVVAKILCLFVRASDEFGGGVAQLTKFSLPCPRRP